MLAGGAVVVGVGSGLISHATFLKGYLDSKGADPVDFSEFETLQGSTATGAENIGRLTNLQHLNVDTSWFIRYRSAKNPDFSYADGTPKGLLTGKKATFIIATGGIYDAQTQMASFNFVEPYLRSVFGFLGVTDATFLAAGGTAALNYGQDRDAFLAPHLQTVQTHAQAI
jgi:hypothetical protein